MPKILVVDDDTHIRDVVSFALRREGMAVVEAESGQAAMQTFTQEQPDIVVLDILIPDFDGIEVCAFIRDQSNVPIIFLSSKDAELDRIRGLEAGADDYVTKPFSPRELVARIRAQLRREASRSSPPTASVSIGPLTIDADQMIASINDQKLSLTRTEFNLLITLARQSGKVLQRNVLMNGAYDRNRVVSGRTIDSHVRRLREKLRDTGFDPIETVHGVGFRLNFE